MRFTISLFTIFMAASCNSKQPIDLLITNGIVYTVDSTFSKSEAIAIDKGKIVDIGTSADLEFKYQPKEEINARRNYIYPGFIDAHAHFLMYGMNLQTVNLTGTQSWDEVVDRVQQFSDKNPKNEGWIQGMGWDQNDWETKEFPSNEKLNELFPDRPVILSRVDGHAAIANNKALQMAGVHAGDKIKGGDYEVRNGKLTGILIDNAMGKVYDKIPEPDVELLKKAFIDAQQNCFAAGLTSIVDCGLDYKTVKLIDSLQKANNLKMRLYILLSDKKENYDSLFNNGKIKTDRLHVNGFKLFSDGALGSRGACLLQPYSDRPDWTGFLLSPAEHFDSAAAKIYEHDMQMVTHAIGDSANRVILNIYAKYLKGKNDRRWRIEHAQVIDENDFHLFGDFNVIPSVQPTHATSDMYWAADRLGDTRIKDAYANRRLMEQNGWIPLGTDFPVEDISPIKTFHAAVVRKDASGFPPEGFQMENALTREDALRGMTIWAAKSSFDEKEKGSIEKGKFADLTILDTDLMKAEDTAILKSRVLKTFVNGEMVYEAREER